MAHSFLSAILKSAFCNCLKEEKKESLVFKAKQEVRRKFLQDTAIAGAGMLLIPSLLSVNNSKQDKKIAVVGAGMAGLNAAYQLKKVGLKATIYEAASRTGGRMYTMQHIFGENITTDIGGEFVDAAHQDIIDLTKEFNLDLYDLTTETLIKKTFYFKGKQYSEKELADALQPFVQQILKDILLLPEIKNHTTAALIEQFDQKSVAAYITAIGISGWLYSFLCTIFTSEFGMEAMEQSALNFLIMFVAPVVAEGTYQLFGTDHEVFKIKGGSQHLTNRMAAALKNNIRLEHELVAIESNNYLTILSFINKGKKVTVTADYVVMTLPFTLLKNITFNMVMDPQKRKCINELGYGNSSKFIMGFKEKVWHNTGKQGYTFTDEAIGTGWDSSQLQGDNEGSFTVFGGGNYSVDINNKNQEFLANGFLLGMDKIYPGSSFAYTGKNIKFCWANSLISKAGYSCYKVGQYSTIAGWEGSPVGNILFAGEHTSRNFQGYMNGAAETGKLAAEQIAAKILHKKNIDTI